MPVVYLFDADGLASQRSAEINLLAIEAEAAASGDVDRPVVEGIVGLWDAEIRARRSGVELGRTFHCEGLVGPLVIELLDELVELGLLLEGVGAGGAGGLLFEREVHAFMAAVLLWVAGANAFDADAQTKPPNRKLGEVE